MTTSVALPTHEQGLARFDEVIARLLEAGFTRHRVDTLQHPLDAAVTDRRQQMTVRHHFTHGEWELFYEPDRTWTPASRSQVVIVSGNHAHPVLNRTVRIRLDRPLPSVEAVISELFGPVCGRYFPAKAPVHTSTIIPRQGGKQRRATAADRAVS